MSKLLMLDKDGTLTTTVSGAKFVQHPKDQKLLPGVAEALQRYANDGWRIGIASNQGGVAGRECSPIDFPVGAYYVNGTDQPVRVIRKRTTPGGIQLETATPRANGKDSLYFDPSSRVKFQYKTIDDAVAEMQYCLRLAPVIKGAAFCPDAYGREVKLLKNYQTHSEYAEGFSNRLSQSPGGWSGSFRKPGDGMINALLWLLTGYGFDGRDIAGNCLFVGDRPEDEGAAKTAGIPFMWASEWRGDDASQ